MCTEQSDSMIKKALKSVCCDNGWSYGVFWRFDKQNSLLLAMQDAYYEDQMGVVIDDMLLQVHMLGGGIIGQTAFTKRHRWMFSDTHYGGQNPIDSIESHDIFQDDSEFYRQFYSGIKTIAVISVEPQGVVQFGSTQKILERTEFIDQTKKLFREMESDEGLISSGKSPFSPNSESYGQNGLFASLISTGTSKLANFKLVDGEGCRDMMETSCSSMNLTPSFSFYPDRRRMNPLMKNSSRSMNRFQIAGIEAQFLSSNKSNIKSQQPFLQSTSSGAHTPCRSTWSSGDSTLTSFIQQLPSEVRSQDSQNMPFAKPNNLVSCCNTVRNFGSELTSTSLYGRGLLIDTEKTSQYSLANSMNSQHSSLSFHATKGKLPERPTSLCSFEELFEKVDYDITQSKSCPLDDLSQWFAPSPDQSCGTLVNAVNDDVAQAMGLISVSSNLNECGNVSNVPLSHLAHSVESSITNISNFDGEEKPSNFGSFGLDFECGMAGDWDEILMPVVNDAHLDFSTDHSECISGQHIGHREGLFSEPGLEQFFEGIGNTSSSVSRSSFEDQLSFPNKRRRVETSFESNDQVQLAGVSCFGQNINSLQPVYNLDGINNLGFKKDVITKSDTGSLIGDGYSMNVGITVSQPKKHEKPEKGSKKKAKRGTRPRPKDRQQIHDRVIELRKLIPNSEKMSIDCLFDRTIKHLLFLQSMTKHADRLRQADELKLGQQNRMVEKDNSCSSGSGITWACEVGAETMVCPLIVEDLRTPGQMLIEMLCEQEGLFLEIVDIVRGFGLIILKGVMEVQELKLWARFIVESEVKRHVTRHEIFSSLVQLLQLTNPTGVNVSDAGMTLLNNFQQSVVPLRHTNL